MARPIKQGLEYFSLDCVLDDKFKSIELDYGLKGFAVVVKLFQKIYGGFGYYTIWNRRVAELFARENSVGGSVVAEIITASIKEGIFNGDLFDRYGILTSAGIQKRYFASTAKRKKVEVIGEYLLIKVNPDRVNVVINSINSVNNPVNSVNNSQSKVKESKVKESKENMKNGVNDGIYSDGFQRATIAAKNVGMRYIPSALNDLVEECGCDLVIRAIKEESSVDGFVTMHMVRERVKELKGGNND